MIISILRGGGAGSAGAALVTGTGATAMALTGSALVSGGGAKGMAVCGMVIELG
jgi:hypothetical protein